MQAPSNAARDFSEVIAKTYKEQAIFFLNAFWPEFHADAERVWAYVQKMAELDQNKGKEGNELDEFSSHRFLEFWQETATVMRLRDMLRDLGLNRNKKMSLIEYLVVKYRQTVQELLRRPQGTNEELVKAQRALDAVNTEIQKIETRKRELEQASGGTGIRAMQAKNELAQLLGADPTDLNRALLTAEAAVRKAQRMGGEAAAGHLWFLERELTEMKKYKPKSQGGISRN
eukprot:TRINITY_DN255_c0_g1_i2.p1 TRINITY_DN255_c0_g1~~TRINITY_DN255_c0_g1_i2.p1  ORF type:complete len:230 (+),score=61.25 TRINITY_DN255_c0_g1_i2:72-761(+)